MRKMNPTIIVILFAVLCIVVSVIVGVTAYFHRINSASEYEGVPLSAKTAEPYEFTYSDLNGLISGLGDVAVLQGAENVDLLALVSWDDTVITEVSLDTGMLDFSMLSSIPVTYTIIADTAALARHLGVEYSDQQESAVTFTVKARVYVISEEEAADFQNNYPDVPIYSSENVRYVPLTAETPVEDGTQEEEVQTDLEAQQEAAAIAAVTTSDSGSDTNASADTNTDTGTDQTGVSISDTSDADTGADPSGDSSQTTETEHQHVWKDHIATRWVSNIVSVPDYGMVAVSTQYIFLYDGYTTTSSSDADKHAAELSAEGKDNGYRTKTTYEEQIVGYHDEDQGYYETYVDYQYCDCGAVR